MQIVTKLSARDCVAQAQLPLWFRPFWTTKDSSKNNGINLSRPRLDGIVPFAMKGVWQDGKRRHLFIGHFTTGKVAIGVELALHRQACLGRGRSDQLEDHCVAHERLAAPVLTDPGKEAVLNLCPFTRSQS